MDIVKANHQHKLEELYNKNQLMDRIRAEFTGCKDFNFVKYIEQKRLNVKFAIDLLAQMALHKRANLPTLIGCLRHHFDQAQECADALLAAAEADLVDYSHGLQMFVVKFTISEDVQAELDRFQFPLPMVVEPRELKSNLDSAYLTGKGSVILRNNHHMDDVCLDHLNRLNRIKFTINLDTVRMVKNEWRNLDKPKAGESKDDFKARKKAFEKYDTTARDVITILTEHGNEFYLTHRPDKRGRTYCQGYHVNYQGAAWNKAVIELVDQEIVE